jgi:hypothetical protein
MAADIFGMLFGSLVEFIEFLLALPLIYYVVGIIVFAIVARLKFHLNLGVVFDFDLGFKSWLEKTKEFLKKMVK